MENTQRPTLWQLEQPMRSVSEQLDSPLRSDQVMSGIK